MRSTSAVSHSHRLVKVILEFEVGANLAKIDPFYLEVGGEDSYGSVQDRWNLGREW